MARAEREKERLVTLDRFLWMSPECWWHQSDWRAFNNYIYLLYWSHDPYRFKREHEQICDQDVLYSCKRTAQTTDNYLLLITDVAEQRCRHLLPRYDVTVFNSSVPRKPVYSDQTFFSPPPRVPQTSGPRDYPLHTGFESLNQMAEHK